MASVSLSYANFIDGSALVTLSNVLLLSFHGFVIVMVLPLSSM